MENPRRAARSMIGLAVTTLCALSSYQQVLVRADDVLYPAVCEAFDFSGVQLTALKEERLVSNLNFTSYTTAEGEWITIKESNGKPVTKTVWTSGMMCGMFWYQFEATGEEIWKVFAEDIQVGLAGVEVLDDNDLGFQVLNSFGHAYRLLGDDTAKGRVLTAADTLHANRWVPEIPAFWTWTTPSRRPDWYQAVNVDMIMNMELMTWAACNGGDPDYLEMAIGHADSTWEDLVRDDHSTWHVVEYDNVTYEAIDKGTYQGWTDDSTWSRGQAWAIHGYTMLYRYSPEERFLERADLLLGKVPQRNEYFNDNNEDDNIPLADFDAPKDKYNPRDSSSTAIVCSALLDLFQLTGIPTYLEMAETYLSSLLFSSGYFDPAATDGWEAILRASASEYDASETGSITGDYYTLECMVRYKTMAPSVLLLDEDSAGINDDDLTQEFAAQALDNDVDISGLSEDLPVVIWFGVTLSDTAKVPNMLSIGSVAVDIEPPTGGWVPGTNRFSFSVSPGTFSGLDTVESVSVDFAFSASGSTTSTINYLIVGHRFNTFKVTDDDSEEDSETDDDSEEDSETDDDSEEDSETDGDDGVSVTGLTVIDYLEPTETTTDGDDGVSVTGLTVTDYEEPNEATTDEDDDDLVESVTSVTITESTTETMTDEIDDDEIGSATTVTVATYTTETATDDDSETTDTGYINPDGVICAQYNIEGLDGDRGVCCPTSCGQCGGQGCSSLGADCCQGNIVESGVFCHVTLEAPCILPPASTDGS